jgi:hypothetical protein
MIYYEFTFYVYVESGEDEQPLLDTNFPDVSFQKEGLQINTYRKGVRGCPELRRLSLWKVVNEFPEDGDDDRDEPVMALPARKKAPPKTHGSGDHKQSESRREEDAKTGVSSGDCDLESGSKAVSKSMDTGRKASLPHHIAPLKSNAATVLTKMPDLGIKAPWDDTGRPLGLRASK